MFFHLFHDIDHCNVAGIFDYALVQPADDVLNHAKGLEQLAAGVKDLL